MLASRCRSLSCAGTRNQHTGKPSLCRPIRAVEGNVESSTSSGSSRRNTLASIFTAATLLSSSSPALAVVRDVNKEVSSYLPASESLPGFVQYIPGPSKTPSLRAGTVDAANPYQFALPSSFTELKISNTQSGNYCQPRCDEPWTEVAFADPSVGKLELIVSPLEKFTPKKKVKIQDLGNPKFLIGRIGNFITGSYLDEDDIVSATEEVKDGLTYYYYEINAGYAKVGTRSISAVAVKGGLVYLLVASASEKQWKQYEGDLKTAVATFRA